MQHFERVFDMFMQHSDRLIGILVIFCITILVILLIRFLVLWYFRVNEALNFLEWQKNILMQHFSQHAEIIRLLKKIACESETDARKTGAGGAQAVDTGRQPPEEMAQVNVAPQQPQELALQGPAQAPSPQESLEAILQPPQQPTSQTPPQPPLQPSPSREPQPQEPQPPSQWETKTCPYCRKPNAPMSPYCCHCFEKLA